MKFLPNTSLLLKAAAVCAVSLIFFGNSYAQDTKIGFVSTERIFREANPSKAANAKIDQEFSKRDKELRDAAAHLKALSDKLDKDAPVLSDSDRAKRQREVADMDKEVQRKQREFREDLNQRKNEELAIVLDRTNKAIKQIAEAEKFDLVLQEAVYISPRIDITDKVLKVLNK
ncbi:MAG: OmpH family outer membrane protein [Herbaspirillum sp.]